MNATDAHTVNTQMLCREAGIHRVTVNHAMHCGLIARGKRRNGVRGVWWTPAQANRFLKLRGHQGAIFKD